MVVFLDREEASALSWKIHAHKPSTHVLTPSKLGSLREVACDNILNAEVALMTV